MPDVETKHGIAAALEAAERAGQAANAALDASQRNADTLREFLIAFRMGLLVPVRWIEKRYQLRPYEERQR